MCVYVWHMLRSDCQESLKKQSEQDQYQQTALMCLTLHAVVVSRPLILCTADAKPHKIALPQKCVYAHSDIFEIT